MTAPAAVLVPARTAPGSVAATPGTAEQWRVLAPLLAARDTMRLSYDRGKNYPRRLQRPLAADPPNCPAAVYIYDASGETRLLAADFDPKRAYAQGAPDPARQAAEDAAAFARLIRACGGRSFGDLSPLGGRHGYVIWAEPVPHAEMRRIALALARRYPSFDPKPMLGREHGIITVPGSRHRSGGIRTLTTPLDAARRCADAPCGPATWTRLCSALAPELEAVSRGECPQRPALEQLPGDTPRRVDAAGVPWLALPGGRVSSLRADLELVAVTGDFDRSRYASPSEARFAVLGSAAARGWHLSDVMERIQGGAWPGLAQFYHRYRTASQRKKALRGDWRKAVGGAGGKRTGRPCHTRENNHTGGTLARPGEGDLVPGGYAEIRRWDSAVRAGELHRYRGPHGITIRLVLRALAAAAQMTGSTVIEFGCRSLSLQACVDHSTVARVLRELCQEHDPYLVCLEEGRGIHADKYLLRIPDAYQDAAEWSRWRPGRIGVHPVFRVLEHAAALVLEQLASEPVRTADLPVLTGLAPTTVNTALATLSVHRIAVRTPGGWRRGPADLDDVAVTLGVPEILASILERHQKDRSEWRLRLTAAPAAPASVPEEDIPWPEAPAYDEYGEPVPARGPPPRRHPSAGQAAADAA